MVAFNFQGRFADDVAAGRKPWTIRRRKRASVGDALQLYTGQRTPDCRKLVTPDPICTISTYCALRTSGITLGNVLSIPEHLRDWDAFARADGFSDYDDMLGWFEGQYGPGEFVGHLHGWLDFTPPEAGR